MSGWPLPSSLGGFDSRSLSELSGELVRRELISDVDISNMAAAGTGTPRKSFRVGPGTVIGCRTMQTDPGVLSPLDPVAHGCGVVVQLLTSGVTPGALESPIDLAAGDSLTGVVILRNGDVMQVPYGGARVEPFATAAAAAMLTAKTLRAYFTHGVALGPVQLPMDLQGALVMQGYDDIRIPTQLATAVDTSSTELAPENLARRDVILQNFGADPVGLLIGPGAAVFADTSLRLDGFQSLNFRSFGLRTTGRIAAIRDGGATTADVGVTLYP